MVVGLWLPISCEAWLWIRLAWKIHSSDYRAISWRCFKDTPYLSWKHFSLTLWQLPFCSRCVVHPLQSCSLCLPIFHIVSIFDYFFPIGSTPVNVVHAPNNNWNIIVNFAALILFSHLTRVYAEWDSMNTKHKYKWHKWKDY